MTLAPASDVPRPRTRYADGRSAGRRGRHTTHSTAAPKPNRSAVTTTGTATAKASFATA
ncbi:hypothetical protein [Streptomyces sp. G45]|uniref:hypothetical protein n=1 Tax=Streptomyces sp. G45 TaxID=3406627 RepID=UPI003C1A6933